MDALHSIAFYVFAVAALAASLSFVLPQGRPFQAAAQVVFAIGVAGLLASLSAGFAALVALVSLGACALFGLGRAALVAAATPGRVLQATGIGSAVLFLLIAFVGFRGDFHPGAYPGGGFGSAALARVLFERDALAVEAVAAAVMACLAAVAVPRLRATRRR